MSPKAAWTILPEKAASRHESAMIPAKAANRRPGSTAVRSGIIPPTTGTPKVGGRRRPSGRRRNGGSGISLLPLEPGAGLGARARRAPRALARREVDLDPALGALERREVVLLAHVDAVHGTGVDAQRAEQALRVVDLVLLEVAALALDLDAVDGAGLRAEQADDALVGLELVEPPLVGREVGLLLGVLHGRRLREEEPGRELHAHGGRADPAPYAPEVAHGQLPPVRSTWRAATTTATTLQGRRTL